MRNHLPAAVLFLFAAILTAGGIYAYSQAPAGTNPVTAFIPIGSALLIVVCAGLAASARTNPRLGNAGALAGMILSLLLTAAFVMPAMARTRALANYPAAEAEFREAIKDPKNAALQTDPALRKQFFRDRKASDHDSTYLRNTLWTLVGAGGLTFATLLVLRLTSRRPAA